MKKILLVSFVAILIDQFIKITVSTKMVLHSSIGIINNFFNITFVKNFGAAYSIFSGNRIFLILVSFISLIIIYFIFLKNKKFRKIDIINYGLLIGGIVGNLIDRIIYGYVIDFLDFNIFGYDFPVFNIADACIVISVISIIIFSKDDKNEVSNKRFRNRNKNR